VKKGMEVQYEAPQLHNGARGERKVKVFRSRKLREGMQTTDIMKRTTWRVD